ncbi:MAG: hypothetical protein WCG27_10845 [Pseudomonadota bacterium]
MYFKLSPWDFFERYPHGLPAEGNDFHAYWTFDPFIEKFALNRLRKNLTGEHKILLASELTLEWAEQNLLYQDFFSQNSCYLILMADSLPATVKNFFLENKLTLEGRSLFFFFNKENSWFDNLCQKRPEGHYVRIEAPRFWENTKLLDFLLKEMNITLSYEIKNYLLQSLPSEVSELYNSLELLQLSYPKTDKITLAMAKELITPHHLDQFQMASLWGQKKKAEVLKKLIEMSDNQQVMIGFFSFMQNHLLKLADPSYLQSKGRPSKYDQEIDRLATQWTPVELEQDLQFLGQGELAAKKKTPLFDHWLKINLVRATNSEKWLFL